jgi:hypothetical protein
MQFFLTEINGKNIPNLDIGLHVSLLQTPGEK